MYYHFKAVAIIGVPDAKFTVFFKKKKCKKIEVLLLPLDFSVTVELLT